MLYWIRRGLSAVLAAVALFVCGWSYLYYRLPDTFLVEQGQSLRIAQLPWLEPLNHEEVVQAGAVPAGSSYNVTLSILGRIPIKTVRAVAVDQRAVTVCGTPFGIKMFAEGATIVGFTDIAVPGGGANPAKSAGLKIGDRILSIDGTATHDNQDVADALQQAAGRAVQVVYQRDGEQRTASLEPIRDEGSDSWRAGMWVRDSSAGIGTLTFVDNSTGMYGGLGHPISDADTGQSIALRSGEISPVTITGYQKGEAGMPGELKGRFTSQLSMGDILTNGATGVYGKIRGLCSGQDMIVAQAQQVYCGPARMLTTLDGTTPQWYDVEIERVALDQEDPNRNMVIRVTDPRLLSSTGGIVQGMSGSPIEQDGKFVGAVTHVLVNDPTRGYGIFAQTMLETADALQDSAVENAA